jgi:hypothetical protein
VILKMFKSWHQVLNQRGRWSVKIEILIVLSFYLSGSFPFQVSTATYLAGGLLCQFRVVVGGLRHGPGQVLALDVRTTLAYQQRDSHHSKLPLWRSRLSEAGVLGIPLRISFSASRPHPRTIMVKSASFSLPAH